MHYGTDNDQNDLDPTIKFSPLGEVIFKVDWSLIIVVFYAYIGVCRIFGRRPPN